MVSENEKKELKNQEKILKNPEKYTAELLEFTNRHVTAEYNSNVSSNINININSDFKSNNDNLNSISNVDLSISSFKEVIAHESWLKYAMLSDNIGRYMISNSYQDKQGTYDKKKEEGIDNDDNDNNNTNINDDNINNDISDDNDDHYNIHNSNDINNNGYTNRSTPIRRIPFIEQTQGILESFFSLNNIAKTSNTTSNNSSSTSSSSNSSSASSCHNFETAGNNENNSDNCNSNNINSVSNNSKSMGISLALSPKELFYLYPNNRKNEVNGFHYNTNFNINNNTNYKKNQKQSNQNDFQNMNDINNEYEINNKINNETNIKNGVVLFLSGGTSINQNNHNFNSTKSENCNNENSNNNGNGEINTYDILQSIDWMGGNENLEIWDVACAIEFGKKLIPFLEGKNTVIHCGILFGIFHSGKSGVFPPVKTNSNNDDNDGNNGSTSDGRTANDVNSNTNNSSDNNTNNNSNNSGSKDEEIFISKCTDILKNINLSTKALKIANEILDASNRIMLNTQIALGQAPTKGKDICLFSSDVRCSFAIDKIHSN